MVISVAGLLLLGCSSDPNESVRQSSDDLYELVEIDRPTRIIRDESGRDGAHWADLAVESPFSSGDIEVPEGYELDEPSTHEDDIASYEGPDPLEEGRSCTVNAWRLPDPTFDLRAGEEAVRLSAYCGFES